VIDRIAIQPVRERKRAVAGGVQTVAAPWRLVPIAIH
jgi:hypothetical protein